MRGGARAGRGRRDALCASAAPRPARASALAAAAAAAAVILALVPVGVGFSPAAPPYVHKSEAFAAVPAPNSKAVEFIQACANAAGLNVSDYMLTCGIVIGGCTGLNILGEDVTYSADQANQSIVKMVSTLEWPDWDELSDEDKSTYGNNKDLYYANQFNTLAGCFGLAESRDVFYVSDGGNLDEGATTTAARIGEIGNKFATGAIMQASDVYSSFKNAQPLVQHEGFGILLTKEKDLGDLHIKWMTSYCMSVYGYGRIYPSYEHWYMYNEIDEFSGSGTSLPFVYYMPWGNYVNEHGNGGPIEIRNNNGNVLLRKYQDSWDAGVTRAWINPLTGNNGYSAESGGTTTSLEYRTTGYLNINYAGGWYYNGEQVNLDEVGYSEEMPETPVGTYDDKVRPEGIGGKTLGPETKYTDITGTPREPEDPPYTPPTPEERPQNPFNPSDSDNPSYQSGTPEWIQETTENLEPALNIRFNELFPFCLIYDIELFWNKMKSVMVGDPALGEQAVNDYEHLSIPGLETVEGMENGIEFDLQPLREMLNLIKPYMFWLLLITMIMSVVEFWRRILTGA